MPSQPKKTQIADSISMIQGGLTAGSMTSKSSCEAVRICCGLLVERLSILRDRLQGERGAVNWETLIAQAGMQSMNMSASTYYVPGFSSMTYLNYRAAVSEVEVNLLTGETCILWSNIIYDCGQSLNPAVDLGQIEGSFVQGIGFFLTEEYLSDPDGLVVSDNMWTYKIPTVDTIPKQFNVEILNSGHWAPSEPDSLIQRSTRNIVRNDHGELMFSKTALGFALVQQFRD